MKYDDFEKIESSNYPNNIIVENSGVPKHKLNFLKKLQSKDTLVACVACSAIFTCVLLLSSVIALAIGGNLGMLFS